MILSESIAHEWGDVGEIECIYITGDPQDSTPSYSVGHAGVTRIEKTLKSGEMSYIPYVRVWADKEALAEFCQHRLAGVYFFARPAP